MSIDVSGLMNRLLNPLIDRIMFLEAKLRLLEGRDPEEIQDELVLVKLALFMKMNGASLADLADESDAFQREEMRKARVFVRRLLQDLDKEAEPEDFAVGRTLLERHPPR